MKSNQITDIIQKSRDEISDSIFNGISGKKSLRVEKHVIEKGIKDGLFVVYTLEGLKSLKQAVLEKAKKTKGSKKFEKVMHEFKTGKLRSTSKHGNPVTDKKQAIVIAFSEARKKNKNFQKDIENLYDSYDAEVASLSKAIVFDKFGEEKIVFLKNKKKDLVIEKAKPQSKKKYTGGKHKEKVIVHRGGKTFQREQTVGSKKSPENLKKYKISAPDKEGWSKVDYENANQQAGDLLSKVHIFDHTLKLDDIGVVPAPNTNEYNVYKLNDKRIADKRITEVHKNTLSDNTVKIHNLALNKEGKKTGKSKEPTGVKPGKKAEMPVSGDLKQGKLKELQTIINRRVERESMKPYNASQLGVVRSASRNWDVHEKETGKYLFTVKGDFLTDEQAKKTGLLISNAKQEGTEKPKASGMSVAKPGEDKKVKRLNSKIEKYRKVLMNPKTSNAKKQSAVLKMSKYKKQLSEITKESPSITESDIALKKKLVGEEGKSKEDLQREKDFKKQLENLKADEPRVRESAEKKGRQDLLDKNLANQEYIKHVLKTGDYKLSFHNYHAQKLANTLKQIPEVKNTKSKILDSDYKEEEYEGLHPSLRNAINDSNNFGDLVKKLMEQRKTGATRNYNKEEATKRAKELIKNQVDLFLFESTPEYKKKKEVQDKLNEQFRNELAESQKEHGFSYTRQLELIKKYQDLKDNAVSENKEGNKKGESGNVFADKKSSRINRHKIKIERYEKRIAGFESKLKNEKDKKKKAIIESRIKKTQSKIKSRQSKIDALSKLTKADIAFDVLTNNESEF